MNTLSMFHECHSFYNINFNISFQAKPVQVPDAREEKLPRVFNPPEFIRNIWGMYQYIDNEYQYIHP